MARNHSGDFEEVHAIANANADANADANANDNAIGIASPMSSLASALASAAATERDHRQRKSLVENMVHLLFDALGVQDATMSQSKFEQAHHLVQQILGKEETGSTTIVNSFLMTTPVTKIIMNQNKPLKVHWSWQTLQDRDGATDYSTCYLSVFAKEGVTIELFAPPLTLSAEPRAEEILKIAVCEVSNFQWTLEGTTKKESAKEASLKDIQSFWKLESASFSWISGLLGEIPAEEVLLEGRDISLTGKIMEGRDKCDSLQLQSKSVLSLMITSVGSLGLSDKEMRRVGMSLRSLVNFLDGIVYVPELHLSLIDFSEITESGSSGENAKGEAIPPFEEDGDSTSLGGAMKYYLKHYCNGTNQKQATTFVPSSKLLSMVDFASLKDGVAAAARRTNVGSNYLIESKERYAAAAGDAAGAAAITGKKIVDRGGALVDSIWTSVGSLGREEEQEEQQEESASVNIQPTTSGRFQLRETFRKVVAHGKEATGRLVANGNEQSEGLRFGSFSSGLFASKQGTESEKLPLTEQERSQHEQHEI